MHDASLNLQRCIHVKFGVNRKSFGAKHVKLCGELVSLRQKLPCFSEKLPSFAENMSARALTHIDFVRAPKAPARVVSPIENLSKPFKEHLCQESN
jgi:hypothetical protein